MRAWLPEPEVRGPFRAEPSDIDALNRVFAEAFTDRYRRDGLVGVRVPPLDPRIWRFALLDAGEGAMLWRDEHDRVVAFNLAHRCGAEGWMGPLAVRTDRQGGGVGKRVVGAAVEWLRGRGARTIGLETMPRTVDNIGFYARLGFRPGHLTVTMGRDLAPGGGAPDAGTLLSRTPGADKAGALEGVRALTEALIPGRDYTREILLTAELGLGDVSLVPGRTGLDAFALWHTAPLAAARGGEELRVLKLAARDGPAFDAAVRAVEQAAAGAGVPRVTIRCQTAYGDAFRRLVERGYGVRWTDLRMTLADFPEPHPAAGVLFSNWEI